MSTGAIIQKYFWDMEEYLKNNRWGFWKIFIDDVSKSLQKKNPIKFTLQSNSGFCPRNAEWCWDSSLTISQDTTIYQNNKKACSSKTKEIDWKKLAWSLHFSVLRSINIPALCSSCFDGVEMTLSISNQDEIHSIDFDSARRFDFDKNNVTHVQLKDLINSIDEIWSKNRSDNEEIVCSLVQ